MAEQEIKVKTGMLSFRRPKGQLIKKYKEYYALLFANSGCGTARVEFYESQKASCSGPFALIIPGSDVITVKLVSGNNSEERHAFMISTREQQYTFCAKDASDCESWVKAIQETLWKPFQQHLENVKQKPVENKFTVDNDIYIPAEEVCREYVVTVGAETRGRLGADGKVRLLVENGHITIIHPSGNRIVRWGIETLRRMGYTDNNFHVEAGRKSPLGEGEFIFITKSGKQIYSLVTKEKEVCRLNSAKGKGHVLPPGQVTPPTGCEPEPFTFGCNIYENSESLKQKLDKASFKDDRPNHKPDKPPRISSPKKHEGFPPLPAPLNVAGHQTPTLGKNGHVGSPTLALAGLPSTKSLPSNTGTGYSFTSMRPASQVLPTLASSHPPVPSSNQIYSEPIDYQEAWKLYSRDDDVCPEDSAYDERTYDSLRYFRPTVEQEQENHYAYNKLKKPVAGGEQVEKALKRSPQQHQVTEQEPLYAVIDKSRKSHPNTAGSRDPGVHQL